MPDTNGLRFAAISLILAGLSLVGYVALGGVDASGPTGSGSSDAKAQSNTPAKVESGPPTNAWPKQKLRYDFPGGGNPVFAAVGFQSDTQFEAINGTVATEFGKDGVSGYLEFDGTSMTGSGKIEIAVDALRTGNTVRDEHLLGWFGFEESDANKKITFTAESLKHVGGDTYDLGGTMTIRGKSQPHNLQIRLTYLSPALVDDVLNGGKGADIGKPWVHLMAKFQVSRKAHGVEPPEANPAAEAKVEDFWDINVDLRGRSETKVAGK